ncbi:MAG: hypothetical protein IKY78_10990 [Clostridia bacterium]|nr:hypothetical protein [Clostridia bacterium]
MHNENIITFSPFEDADDFKLSLIRGKEIEFHYNGINYGVFYDKNFEKAFYLCYSDSEAQANYFETVDDLLDCMIQKQPLRDIIARVEVLHRNI